MASKLRQLSVNNRRFGFKYGNSYLAIKEYRRDKCQTTKCGHGLAFHDGKCVKTDCNCDSYKQAPLLSFMVDRPEVINHRTMRELIKAKIEKGN